LLKLGITISERTVSRILPQKRQPPSQTWKTFLDNHLNQLVPIDFLTVPNRHLSGSVRFDSFGPWAARCDVKSLFD